MPRYILYFVLLTAISIPAVLLARTFIGSDGASIQGMIAGVEDERLAALLDAASLDEGLVISTGSDTHRFSLRERHQARALLDDLTGIDGALEVRVRQRQVSCEEGHATAVVNLQVGPQDYVALRLSFSRIDQGWSLDRIRIMS